MTGGTLTEFGMRVLTAATQFVRRDGGVPLPGYAYEPTLPASVQICDMTRPARNAASARTFDWVTVLMATACMATIEKTPIEKIRMATSASSSMTPDWRPCIVDGMSFFTDSLSGPLTPAPDRTSSCCRRR